MQRPELLLVRIKVNNPYISIISLVNGGAPEGIRTPDPLIRSQVLYPAELPAHYKYYKLKTTKRKLFIYFFPRLHS
jgi:hypothetical protein